MSNTTDSLILKNIHCLATEQQIELAWQFGADGSVNTLPCVPGEELECITTALRQREEGKHAHTHHHSFLFCPNLIPTCVFSWLVHIWIVFLNYFFILFCRTPVPVWWVIALCIMQRLDEMYFQDARKQHLVTRIALVQGHMLFICCVGQLFPRRLGRSFFSFSN